MPLEYPEECMQKLSEAGLTDVRYIVALTQNERPERCHECHHPQPLRGLFLNCGSL